MLRRRQTHLLVCALLLAASASARSQVFVVGEKTATADVTTEFHATHVELPQQPLDDRTRLDLIRNLEAEQGFAHRELPAGTGLVLVANGNMSPRNEEYKRMLYEKGQAAGPGERVEITSLKFKSDAIIVDFNGGPYAKHRFLSHIEINDIQLAPTGAPATGFRITLAFEGGVPAVSAAEVKALLDPMVDFKAKSSVEAYTNTLAPKVRLAVESHDILVGMDRQMVLASVGPPASRHRERTASTSETASGYNYEEWIYGQTPEPIRFVRFRNGRVVRLEIAEIGKPIEVHDKNEMGNAAEPALLARTISNGDAQPTAEGDQHAAHPPTLRKPGEVIEGASNVGKVRMPDDPDAPPKALPPPPQP